MRNVPMTRPHEALAILATPYYSSSTFVQLDDGRILQCVLGGGFVHSDDGGLTWSKLDCEDHQDGIGNQFRCQFRDTNGDPVGGKTCSLIKLLGKNSIGLYADRNERQPDAPYAVLNTTSSRWFWRSDDNGRTWQPPVRMSAPQRSYRRVHRYLPAHQFGADHYPQRLYARPGVRHARPARADDR